MSLLEATSRIESDGRKPLDHLSLLMFVAGIVAVIPTCIIVSLAIKSLVSIIVPPPILDGYRIGHLALTGEVKTGEAFFPFVFFGAVSTYAWMLNSRFRCGGMSREGRQFLLFQMLLATPIAVPLVLGNTGPLLPLLNSPVLLAAALQLPPAVMFALRRGLLRHSVSPDTDYVPISLYFLSAAWSIGALGFVTLLRYIMAPISVSPTVAGLTALGISLGISVLLAQLTVKGRVLQESVTAWGFAAAGITALPHLLPPLLTGDGQTLLVSGIDVTAWKIALCLLAAAIFIETLLRACRRGSGMVTGVSSLAVSALIVPLRANYSLPSISSDDFHFGEGFTPAILWQEFGQLPFVDVLIARGILPNVVPGAMNSLLNDGTAANLQYAYVLVALIVLTTSHVLLRRAVGFAMATAMVTLVGLANAYLEGDLLSCALLAFVLAMMANQARPILLGVSSTLATTLAVLAYPLMGLAVTSVVAMVGTVATLGALLSKSRDSIRRAAIAIVAALLTLVLLMLTPIGSVVQGSLEYVLGNASASSDAFGVSLDAMWRTPLAVGQLISLSFVVGVFVTGWLWFQRRNSISTPTWLSYSALGISAVPGLLVVILFNRYMGRIDAIAWSLRPTLGSLVIIGLVVPVVLVLVGARTERKWAWVAIAFAGVISLISVPIGRGGLLTSSLEGLRAPTTWSSAAYVANIPRLGLGQGDTSHLESVNQVYWTSQRLPVGESVLNLSNRNSLNGYFAWPATMGYLAPYNIESSKAELKVIDRLQIQKPTYAFVGPGPWWDGVSLTLRDPLLARWMMDNYTPIRCGDNTWATNNDTPQAASVLNCAPASTQISSDSASLWASSIGAPTDLGLVPSYWGTRSDPLESPSVQVTRVKSTDYGKQVFDLEFDDEISLAQKKKGDMLRLTVSCPSNPAAQSAQERITQGRGTTATVTWGVADDDSSTRSSIFQWGVGAFVIPLDAYPTWYLDKSSPSTLQISTSTGECVDGWQVQAQLTNR
jgi:hypothetical protein